MRLLTRSDFDGLVCGALLKHLGIVDSWTFVHPKDVQDGLVEVTKNDVLANVPFAEGCGMWFDHHSSELARMGRDNRTLGECRLAPSTARVIYDYYDGDNRLSHFSELVIDCDKVDSGQLTLEEIRDPSGGVLLGFVMDPRTGLGRFRDFRVSNLELMETLIDKCAELTVKEILELPDVAERVQLYHEQSELYINMIMAATTLYGNVIVTDLRGISPIYAGNRFLLYAIFPNQNVSVWVVDGKNKKNVSLAIGKSVFNRTCKTDIGALCFSYGGGGHRQVGTCQLPYEQADAALENIVEVLRVENYAG